VIFDSITKYTIVENPHPPQGGVPLFFVTQKNRDGKDVSKKEDLLRLFAPVGWESHGRKNINKDLTIICVGFTRITWISLEGE